MTTNEIRKFIARILCEGVQLSPDAIEFIVQSNNIDQITNQIIGKLRKLTRKPLILTSETIAELLHIKRETVKLRIDAKEVKEDIEIVFNASDVINSEGNIDDFISHFISRFKKIRRIILRERFDARGTITIREAKRIIKKYNDKVKLICIISSKKKADNGNIIFEIEDLTDSIRAIVPFKSNIIDKAEKIVKDEVVFLEGRIINDTFLVNEISQPEVPRINRHSYESENFPDIYAVLISDLHVGSKYFMRSTFNRFLLWINGKIGDEKIRKIARRVKYLIIAGDLIDGIGIYPNQEKELLVKNIKKQYEIVARYLSQIPKHIKIIVIPGNHDATRRALPSPAIFKEYAEPLYKLPNIIMLGDPAYIRLHGMLFLITHGRSLDDILATVPGTHYDRPAEAMIELLRRRHLAPIYGARTPIA
ncbi:MAG: hypothetical protein DRJ21_01485, partial [Candidatus Methanomethylicota archaeon]